VLLWDLPLEPLFVRQPARGLRTQAGQLVASALAGAWRAVPLPGKLTRDELGSVAGHLLASGSGGLAWWKASRGGRGDLSEDASAPLERLHDAYRYNRLKGVEQEHRIADIVQRLRRSGIECVLIKGWAAARLYPDPGLRPVGDIDLIVPPKDLVSARALLAPEVSALEVDLEHDHIGLGASGPDLLLAGSVPVAVAGVEVRLPSPEDHLRILCLHLLAHGGCWPVWLCDVAAAVESRPADFDWDRVMPNDRVQAAWVHSAIGLASHVIGLDLRGTPFAIGGGQVPRWLVRGLLGAWSDPARFSSPPSWKTLEGTGEVLRALRLRWPPNAILESVRRGRAFTRWPRFPHQVADGLRRAGRHYVGFRT
jgi:hypothetical protein